MEKHEIRVVYTDANGDVVNESRMRLDEYTTQQRLGLQRVVGDVEHLIYTQNGNVPRIKWDNETLRQFSTIRRQLLDYAGDVGRIPQQLICGKEDDGEPQAFWEKVFGVRKG